MSKDNKLTRDVVQSVLAECQDVNACFASYDEVAALCRHYLATEQDAARLDYLQRHGETRMVWTSGPEPEPYGDVTDWGINDYPWQIENRGDIRSAIDYHMKHELPEEEAIDAALTQKESQT